MELQSSKLIDANPEKYTNVQEKHIARIGMNFVGSVMFNNEIIELRQILPKLKKLNSVYLVVSLDVSSPRDSVDKMVGYVYGYFTQQIKAGNSTIFILGEMKDYKPGSHKIVNVNAIPTNHRYDQLVRKLGGQHTIAPPPAAQTPEKAEVINIIEDSNEDESAKQNKSTSERVYDVVEKNASFPGGDEACVNWIRTNLKYPANCLKNNIHGRVIVSFVVLKDGNLSEIKIIRSPNEELSKEAIRLLNNMPKWIPAQMGGKSVNSRFNLPIMFRLP